MKLTATQSRQSKKQVAMATASASTLALRRVVPKTGYSGSALTASAVILGWAVIPRSRLQMRGKMHGRIEQPS